MKLQLKENCAVHVHGYFIRLIIVTNVSKYLGLSKSPDSSTAMEIVLPGYNVAKEDMDRHRYTVGLRAPTCVPQRFTIIVRHM